MKTLLSLLIALVSVTFSFGQTATISGKITDASGAFLAGVTVELLDENGAVVASVANVGPYSFENIATGQTYTLNIKKSGSVLNGLSTYDLVLMHRAILGTGDPLESLKLLAGDVNGSNSLSVADLISIRLMILGIITELPDGRNWGFIPAAYQFQNPSNPFAEVGDISRTFILNEDINDLDYHAFKYGDLNDSVVNE